MADLVGQAVGELPRAAAIGLTDLLVLEQDGTAVSATGQVLLTCLAALLDGHGGITAITGPVSSGLNDTYTITLADGTNTTFVVKNGAQGPQGPTGDTGAAATLKSKAVAYQASASGTVVPTGTWSASVPTVEQGAYLWTRITLTFNSGSPVVFHTAARMGVDGQTFRPNLLHNWYFKKPINQRGVSGTVTNTGYFIDRWKLTSGSVQITEDGLVLNGTIAQILEFAVGQPVKASALTSDGIVDGSYDDSTKTFSITASGQTIIAAKLETGSTQSLCSTVSGVQVLNEIPDYAEQLALCQRMLMVLFGSTKFRASRVTANQLLFTIPLPIVIRAVPALLYANAEEPLAVYTVSNTEQDEFTVSVFSAGGNFVTIKAEKDNHGLTDGFLQFRPSLSSAAFLSAEL